jgi:hypothetical protein
MKTKNINQIKSNLKQLNNSSIMKTKTKMIRWFLVMVLAVVAAGAVAQTNNSPTQTVCLGDQPYRVEETLPNTVYNWRIDDATTGGGWTITGNGNDSITVNWATPGSYVLSIFTTLNGCNGDTSKVTVIVQPPLSVTIAPINPNPICEGGTILFTATVVNGTAPSFQWYVNGLPESGATASTYTYTGVVGGATIYCMVHDTTACAPDGSHDATSNTETVTVNAAIPISVTIAASPDSICLNGVTTLTATALPASGVTINYQWYKDGGIIPGATSSTYQYTGTVVGNSTFTCVITSPDPCATGSPATSNELVINVKPKPITSPIWHN